MNLGKEKRFLEVVLTEEQRNKRGMDAAHKIRDARVARESADAMKKRARDANEMADEMRESADALMRTFESGREFKDVDCSLTFDGKNVVIERLDTGAVVEKREPTEGERQRIDNPPLPIRPKKGEKDQPLTVVGG